MKNGELRMGATPSVVYLKQCPLRGRGIKGVGRQRGKYEVRPLASPFRGSTRVSGGRGFQNPSVTAMPCQLPYEGSQGSHEMSFVVSCPPPYPPPMEGVALCSPMEGRAE